MPILCPMRVKSPPAGKSAVSGKMEAHTGQSGELLSNGGLSGQPEVRQFVGDITGRVALLILFDAPHGCKMPGMRMWLAGDSSWSGWTLG